MNPLISYTLTFNQDPLLNKLTSIQSQLQRTQGSVEKLQSKQSLSDYEYHNFKHSLDKINSNIDHVNQPQKQKLNKLFSRISFNFYADCDKAFDRIIEKSAKSLQAKLVKQIYDSLNMAFSERFSDQNNTTTLLGNDLQRCEDELRKTKFKLDNLFNSYQRKMAFYETRFQELHSMMAVPPTKEETTQTAPVNFPVNVSVQSLSGNGQHNSQKSIEHERRIRALEQTVQMNQTLAGSSYEMIKIRLMELQKQVRLLDKKEVVISKPPPQTGVYQQEFLNQTRDQFDKLNKKILQSSQKLKLLTSQNEEEHKHFRNDIHNLSLRISQTKKSQQQLQNEEIALYQQVQNMVNKMLAKPFDQTFGLTLKQQILFKFAQMRHELLCILRQVGMKVEEGGTSIDRVVSEQGIKTEQRPIYYLNQKHPEGTTSINSSNSKPVFHTHVKQRVSSTTKDEETTLANTNHSMSIPRAHSKSWFKIKVLPNLNNTTSL